MDRREEKNRLRKMMRIRQLALPEEYILAAGENIQDRILSSREYRRADHLFLYVSLPKEPPTHRIIRQALAEGKKVYIPKCIQSEMLAVRITDMDRLVPGRFGIPEPPSCAETITADRLDLMLIPCLSAFPDGCRLGHGGGYYDRFLSGNPEKAVCLCFRRMLNPEIPMAENDVLIPHIVTEEEVVP